MTIKDAKIGGSGRDKKFEKKLPVNDDNSGKNDHRNAITDTVLR